MSIWQIQFYPGEDERNSPYAYIVGITNKQEQAAIYYRFQIMESRPLQDWPSQWQHQIVGKIFQITVKRHRFLYCLDGRKIIILHAFYKKTRRTPQREIQRAQKRYRQYFDSK